MIIPRAGLIVWLHDLKHAKNLDRYGHVHYISKRMHYAVLYTYAERVDETIRSLLRLPYVKHVERSHRSELKTEYSRDFTDKSSLFST